MTAPHRPTVTVITGMSGSGKSVVLNALEDAGHFCVDNLPPELLHAFVALQAAHAAPEVAIAVDARTAASLPQLGGQLERLREEGYRVRLLFLDATTDTLVRRYSETRRRHPLSARLPHKSAHDESADRPETLQLALVEAIELERELLGDLRQQALVIDTSVMRAASLQTHVRALLAIPVGQLTLLFESFAFKRGIPLDADFVFDVRMLPNPYYEAGLRSLTGKDESVSAFLDAHADVRQMIEQMRAFLQHWMPAMARDHRSYVTVAVGCTGGQHRSVYIVEHLSRHFSPEWVTIKRHRELE